jgi:hypothetical protein
MEQMVQLESDGAVGYTWGDAGRAHIFYCSTHRDELGFVWQSG